MHLLDFVLPQRCVVCALSGASVCAACRERLPRLRPPLCARCGAPTSWPVMRCRECSGRRLAFASARAAVVYDAAVRTLVTGWKERGLRRLAALAAELMLELIERPAADGLTAIPAHPDRRLHRGHNPAASLSVELGRRWDLPVESLLVRARAVPRQRGLSLPDRRRNVLGAFAAPARPPPHVAIVDDVYTSGATVAAAAAALRKAGARRVEVVTFARALRGG